MTLRRFTNGISDVSSSDPLGQFPFLDPTKWRIWQSDWMNYDVAQTATPDWAFAQTGTADDVVTPGKLILTLTNASSEGQVQNDHAHFFMVANKKAIFEAKINITKAAGTIGQEGFVVGLTSAQTSSSFMDAPPPTARAFDDGWGFLSYDNTTDIVAFQGENNTYSTEVGVTTYADDTDMILSIYWDGTKSTFYKDGTKICEITTNPPTSVIFPVIYFAAGEAQTDVLSCHYLLAANER